MSALLVSFGVVQPAAAASSVSLTATATGLIKVQWSARAGASSYEVRTSSAQDLSRDVRTYRTTKTSILVRPARTAGAGSGDYTFVNVWAAGRGALAGYPFPHVQLRPVRPSAAAQRVTVATFNVRTAEEDEPGHSWKKRLPVVAAQIDSSKAGVVAVEEAGANLGKVVRGPWDYTIDWQFTELRDAVDPKYQLVSADEYNLGPGGGKEGTRILYDSSRYSVADSGVFAPSPVDSAMRWVPWALFTDLASGRQFFLVAVHLDNRRDSASSRKYYNLRMKQIGSVIAHARGFGAGGTQVIVAGDLNSNIYSLPKNGVHDKLVASGFYDAYATAKHTNEFYDTFNFFKKSLPGASRTDYILTYGALKGAYSYENVIAAGGVVASDHNMQVATVPF